MNIKRDTPEVLSVLKEIVELQNSYTSLLKSNKMTKRAMCDLVQPFSDKYKLTDIQALTIARDNLSLKEILVFLESVTEKGG